ncbi:uncharacterized protein [Diadema antillarum]|uniref:uncharacterized protein n=1 Tax=Diadema antillarum TaxID=105358 RepID=UPI003A85AA44
MDSSVSPISVKEKFRAAAPREPTAASHAATGGQPAAAQGKLTELCAPTATQDGGKSKPAQRTAQVKKSKPTNPAKTQSSTSSDVNTRLSKLEDLLESVIQRLPAENRTANSTGVLHTSAVTPQPRAAHTTDDTYSHTSTQQPYSGEHCEYTGAGMGQTHSIADDEECYPIMPDEVPHIAAKFAVNADIGEPIEEEIAQSATYLLTHQLENKALEETAAKYALPSNCQAMDSPKVNPFIWDNLPTHTKSRDLKLQKIQKSMTKGINAFVRSLPSGNITDPQQDALALLCSSSFELNCLRRELIKPDLDSRCARLCKPENMVGTTNKLLFGDNLSKKVKDLMEEQKVTAGVMKGQRKSYSSPHPYRGFRPSPGFASATHRSYKEAGWSRSRAPATATRPFSGTGDRPFLERNPRQYRQSQAQGNKKPLPPAPHTQRKR